MNPLSQREITLWLFCFQKLSKELIVGNSNPLIIQINFHEKINKSVNSIINLYP